MAPAVPAPTRGGERVRRGAVAVGAGLLAAGLLVAVLGLAGPTPTGIGDNGDGSRLYCAAGLSPDTVDRASNWKNAVVLRFTTGHPPCADHPVSSAVPILRAATLGAGPTWSLNRLGLLYAGLVGGITALAAGAVGARRVAWLAVPLAPLLLAAFPRFFVSTFSEPAGLLGTVAFLLGVTTLAVTAPQERAPRLTGLALVACGAALAATAKPGYAPVALVGLLVCAATTVGARARLRRLGGLAAALALAAAAVPVLTAAMDWQTRNYASINTHNLVFTLALPELGPTATAPLGLPPEAFGRSGEGYYVRDAAGIPGWSATIGEDPARARATTYRLLVERPAALAAALGVGMQATLRADLDYLPSLPLGLPEGSYPPMPDPPMGEQGADIPRFRATLDATPVPWAPSVVAALGVLAGVLGVVPAARRASPRTAAAGRLAGVAALTGTMLVGVAVLGDGYLEVFKHVWLGAYCLAVAAVALAVATTGLAMRALRGRGLSAGAGGRGDRTGESGDAGRRPVTSATR